MEILKSESPKIVVYRVQLESGKIINLVGEDLEFASEKVKFS
jgi:hypothetical protein